ncbi:MAG: hypothetical protein SFV22_17990, partial [Saprospiraceae bacterium]|nr:hypothetical protein [Saprospiraceae bacterium]
RGCGGGVAGDSERGAGTADAVLKAYFDIFKSKRRLSSKKNDKDLRFFIYVQLYRIFAMNF